MYICICNEVTDKAIKQATNSGANSMCDLRDQLNLGTACGQCSMHAKGLLKELLGSKKTP